MKSTEVENLFARLEKEINEPLHPDLLPYFEKEGALGSQLRHPLIYQVPFFSNGLANVLYEQKKVGVAEALKEKNYNRFIYLHERPYRLEAFKMIENRLADTEYWSLLASIWIDTENQWAYLDDWKKLLNAERSSRECLMDEDDYKLFASLPNEIVIYRGCQKVKNENGLSWSLDKSKAEFFANRFGQKGIVLERTITKDQVIAVFTGRGEAEIIFTDTP